MTIKKISVLFLTEALRNQRAFAASEIISRPRLEFSATLLQKLLSATSRVPVWPRTTVGCFVTCAIWRSVALGCSQTSFFKNWKSKVKFTVDNRHERRKRISLIKIVTEETDAKSRQGHLYSALRQNLLQLTSLSQIRVYESGYRPLCTRPRWLNIFISILLMRNKLH